MYTCSTYNIFNKVVNTAPMLWMCTYVGMLIVCCLAHVFEMKTDTRVTDLPNVYIIDLYMYSVIQLIHVVGLLTRQR